MKTCNRCTRPEVCLTSGWCHQDEEIADDRLPRTTGSGFAARLSVTDGGEPIDLIEDDDGGQVWRGDVIVGEGDDLVRAWNDYLYSCQPSAPVNDAELADMWTRYDGQNDTIHP